MPNKFKNKRKNNYKTASLMDLFKILLVIILQALRAQTTNVSSEHSTENSKGLILDPENHLPSLDEFPISNSSPINEHLEIYDKNFKGKTLKEKISFNKENFNKIFDEIRRLKSLMQYKKSVIYCENIIKILNETNLNEEYLNETIKLKLELSGSYLFQHKFEEAKKSFEEGLEKTKGSHKVKYRTYFLNLLSNYYRIFYTDPLMTKNHNKNLISSEKLKEFIYEQENYILSLGEILADDSCKNLYSASVAIKNPDRAVEKKQQDAIKHQCGEWLNNQDPYFNIRLGNEYEIAGRFLEAINIYSESLPVLDKDEKILILSKITSLLFRGEIISIGLNDSEKTNHFSEEFFVYYPQLISLLPEDDNKTIVLTLQSAVLRKEEEQHLILENETEKAITQWVNRVQFSFGENQIGEATLFILRHLKDYIVKDRCNPLILEIYLESYSRLLKYLEEKNLRTKTYPLFMTYPIPSIENFALVNNSGKLKACLNFMYILQKFSEGKMPKDEIKVLKFSLELISSLNEEYIPKEGHTKILLRLKKIMEIFEATENEIHSMLFKEKNPNEDKLTIKKILTTLERLKNSGQSQKLISYITSIGNEFENNLPLEIFAYEHLFNAYLKLNKFNDAINVFNHELKKIKSPIDEKNYRLAFCKSLVDFYKHHLDPLTSIRKTPPINIQKLIETLSSQYKELILLSPVAEDEVDLNLIIYAILIEHSQYIFSQELIAIFHTHYQKILEDSSGEIFNDYMRTVDNYEKWGNLAEAILILESSLPSNEDTTLILYRLVQLYFRYPFLNHEKRFLEGQRFDKFFPKGMQEKFLNHLNNFLEKTPAGKQYDLMHLIKTVINNFTNNSFQTDKIISKMNENIIAADNAFKIKNNDRHAHETRFMFFLKNMFYPRSAIFYLNAHEFKQAISLYLRSYLGLIQSAQALELETLFYPLLSNCFLPKPEYLSDDDRVVYFDILIFHGKMNIEKTNDILLDNIENIFHLLLSSPTVAHYYNEEILSSILNPLERLNILYYMNKFNNPLIIKLLKNWKDLLLKMGYSNEEIYEKTVRIEDIFLSVDPNSIKYYFQIILAMIVIFLTFSGLYRVHSSRKNIGALYAHFWKEIPDRLKSLIPNEELRRFLKIEITPTTYKNSFFNTSREVISSKVRRLIPTITLKIEPGISPNQKNKLLKILQFLHELIIELKFATSKFEGDELVFTDMPPNFMDEEDIKKINKKLFIKIKKEKILPLIIATINKKIRDYATINYQWFSDKRNNISFKFEKKYAPIEHKINLLSIKSKIDNLSNHSTRYIEAEIIQDAKIIGIDLKLDIEKILTEEKSRNFSVLAKEYEFVLKEKKEELGKLRMISDTIDKIKALNPNISLKVLNSQTTINNLKTDLDNAVNATVIGENLDSLREKIKTLNAKKESKTAVENYLKACKADLHELKNNPFGEILQIIKLSKQKLEDPNTYYYLENRKIETPLIIDKSNEKPKEQTQKILPNTTYKKIIHGDSLGKIQQADASTVSNPMTAIPLKTSTPNLSGPSILLDFGYPRLIETMQRKIDGPLPPFKKEKMENKKTLPPKDEPESEGNEMKMAQFIDTAIRFMEISEKIKIERKKYEEDAPETFYLNHAYFNSICWTLIRLLNITAELLPKIYETKKEELVTLSNGIIHQGLIIKWFDENKTVEQMEIQFLKQENEKHKKMKEYIMTLIRGTISEDVLKGIVSPNEFGNLKFYINSLKSSVYNLNLKFEFFEQHITFLKLKATKDLSPEQWIREIEFRINCISGILESNLLKNLSKSKDPNDRFNIFLVREESYCSLSMDLFQLSEAYKGLLKKWGFPEGSLPEIFYKELFDHFPKIMRLLDRIRLFRNSFAHHSNEDFTVLGQRKTEEVYKLALNLCRFKEKLLKEIVPLIEKHRPLNRESQSFVPAMS